MPRVTRLTIPQDKIENYLLNFNHPKGWSKAKFFLAKGFIKSQPDVLGSALAIQAIKGWPGDELRVPGATKHRVTGPIVCPDGTTADILTVWQADDGSTSASFITARPVRRKKP